LLSGSLPLSGKGAAKREVREEREERAEEARLGIALRMGWSAMLGCSRVVNAKSTIVRSFLAMVVVVLLLWKVLVVRKMAKGSGQQWWWFIPAVGSEAARRLKSCLTSTYL
jgi:hypothetical protein